MSSLWLWPAAAIALTGLAGTFFGAIGVLLVGGEALATLVVTAGIVTLSRDRSLAIGMAAALTAAIVGFAGLAWWHELHHKIIRPAPMAARLTRPPSRPPDWAGQRISQDVARRASFRGADLDDSNLDGLQLSHKNFDGARADGATFRGSQLQDASLRGASFRGACLEGANLSGADLAGADFSGADVAGVTIVPKAEKAALVWPGGRTRSAAACQ